MGLLKDIENDTGVVVGYWKINSVVVDMENLSMRVRINGYLNKQAFADGKSVIESRDRVFFGAENPFSSATGSNPMVSLIYQITQSLPEFADSIYDGEL